MDFYESWHVRTLNVTKQGLIPGFDHTLKIPSSSVKVCESTYWRIHIYLPFTRVYSCGGSAPISGNCRNYRTEQSYWLTYTRNSQGTHIRIYVFTMSTLDGWKSNLRTLYKSIKACSSEYIDKKINIQILTKCICSFQESNNVAKMEF